MGNKHEPDHKLSARGPAQTGRRKFLTAAGPLGPALFCGRALYPAQVDKPLLLTTEDRIALALMHFKMGFHCSQSVFEAYVEDFGIDPMMARRMTSVLAGGSTVGGECGAVSSGYLVLGLRHGREMPAHGDVEKEKELFDRVKRFAAEFKKHHGSINCHELLGVDVFTEAGRSEALRKNLFLRRCPNFIRDAIVILDGLG